MSPRSPKEAKDDGLIDAILRLTDQLKVVVDSIDECGTRIEYALQRSGITELMWEFIPRMNGRRGGTVESGDENIAAEIAIPAGVSQDANEVGKSHAEGMDETVRCAECRAECRSLAQALLSGWTELAAWRGGEGNFSALCPEHRAWEYAECDSGAQPPAAQTPKSRLF